MSIATQSIESIGKEFFEFAKNTEFSPMKAGKNTYADDEITFTYACSGPRAAEWGDILFSITIAHEAFKSLVPFEKKVGDVLESAKASKVVCAWVSCSRSIYYHIDNKLVEISNEGKLEKFELTDELASLLVSVSASFTDQWVDHSYVKVGSQ